MSRSDVRAYPYLGLREISAAALRFEPPYLFRSARPQHERSERPDVEHSRNCRLRIAQDVHRRGLLELFGDLVGRRRRDASRGTARPRRSRSRPTSTFRSTAARSAPNRARGSAAARNRRARTRRCRRRTRYRRAAIHDCVLPRRRLDTSTLDAPTTIAPLRVCRRDAARVDLDIAGRDDHRDARRAELVHGAVEHGDVARRVGDERPIRDRPRPGCCL